MDQWNPSFFTRNLPELFEKEMRESASQGARFRCVAFAPGGEETWSIVTNRGFINHNPPAELHDKMNEYKAAGHDILWVAFPPGGGNRWSIITDKTFFNRGVSASCHDRMKKCKEDGEQVLSVAFAPWSGETWSIVTDKNFHNQSPPDELEKKMLEMWDDEDKIRNVAFGATDESWSIIGTKGFFNRKPPHGCHRVMRAMHRTGAGPVRTVAFRHDGSYAIASSAHQTGGEHGPLTAGGKTFSLDTLATKLRKHFQKQVDDGDLIRYGFVVRYGSAIRAWSAGPKRTAADPPAQDFTVYDWVDVGSVGKTFTAVAIRQLLAAKNLDMSASIVPWLPSTWDLGPNIDLISFRELLTHRAGFRVAAHSYDELKDRVADGVTKAHQADDEYLSTNFSLARVLGAYLNGHQESSADQSTATSENFFGYLQENVTEPLGIPNAKWKADAVEPTLVYPVPSTGGSGDVSHDWSVDGGSGGINVSVAELSTFVHSLTTTHSLLDEDAQAAMNAEGTGWKNYDPDNHANGGPYCYLKSGTTEGYLFSVIASFTTGVQVAIAVNGSPVKKLKDLVVEKYDASWS